MTNRSGRDDDDKGESPRVRDLVRPPGAEQGTKLTPEQIEQIVHWFGMPSFDQVGEATVPVTPVARPKTYRMGKELDDAIQPQMYRVVEGHRDDGQAIADAHVLAERPWEHARTTFDERAATPEDLREVPIPNEVMADLKARTPQAMLRDLHRPVKEFDRRYQPPWDDAFEPPNVDPFAPVREVIATRYRAPDWPRSVPAVVEARRDLRDLLGRPWGEAKREKARAREAELLAKLESGWRPGKEPPPKPVPRRPEKRS